MLSDEDIMFLVDSARKMRQGIVGSSPAVEIFDERMAAIQKKLEAGPEVLELLIICPRCLKQHVDEGRFAKDPHKIHACQFCGLGFVVSKQPSIGVQFFDGWKNPTPS